MKSQFGIFTTDNHLVVRTWDRWLEVATSRTAAEVCGKRLTEVFPEIENRGLSGPLKRVLEQGAVELLSPALHGFLIRCPAPAGVTRFQHMQQRTVIAPVRNGSSIEGLVVTIEDVTWRRDEERKHADDLNANDWRRRRLAVEQLSAQSTETVVLDLVDRLRKEHRDPNLLNSVLPLLASGAWETLEPLIELTRDDDGEVRMYAAQTLGKLKDRRAIPVLMLLLDDPVVNVRYHAIEALANLRASEAAGELARIALSGDFFVAFAALDALRSIDEPTVASRLTPLLQDENLRSPAIGALAQLGDHSVVEPLAGLLDRPHLVAVVAEALATLQERYEKQFGEGQYVIDLAARYITETGARNLMDALNTVAGDRLRVVVRVLGWIGDDSMVADLTRLLGSLTLRSEVIETFVRHGARVTKLLDEQLNAEDLETRRAAVAALGRIGNPSSVPALIRALSDLDLTVDAAGALGRVGDRRAYEPLLELLGSDRGAVRRAAISALHSIGHPRMPDDVCRLLVDSNPHIRESGVRIAGYFGYPECETLLLQAVHDSNESVRRAAVENLSNLGDEIVLPVLRAAVRDESSKIRAAAAQSFGSLESVVAVPDLIQAMTDSDAWVRYYAARSLGRLRSPDSIDALAVALRSDSAMQVRIAAADALGSIGGRRTVALLAPFVNSEDQDLAREVLLALGVVGHPDAMEPLMGALRSNDSSRRLDAVRAIAARRDSEAAEALQWTAATDASEAVAEAAIKELAAMATPESIAALLRLRSDRRLREQAILHISRLGRSHIERIKEGLSSPQLEVRRAVVEAFGRMKHPEASQALSVALDDDRPEVRLAALLALRRLGSHVSERKLWAMAQRDPDPGVRQAAHQGLQR